MEKKQNLTVKHWADEDKPREKLLANGKKTLTNAELIAIILGSGNPDQNVVDLAKAILNGANNSLSELAHLEINDLKKHKGIGDAKAVGIVAAMELGYRMIDERSDSKNFVIQNSTDIFQCISPSIIDLPHEEFWALYLNSRNKVIHKQRISTGGITETPVDIRLIFKSAIERNAVSMAVAHNHPSGSLTPSKQDKLLTQNLIEAGKIMHIPVVDHLIVGIDERNKANYFSFFDEGLM